MINYDDINLISDDTYYLDNNDVFIAKKGKNIDLFNLINIAKSKKPKYIITNKKINDIIYIKNLKKFENKIIKKYKINPRIIGVTGTNGKTSTTTIIYSILKSLNKKVMLIGSNGVYYNKLKLKTRNTTPSRLSILYLINKYLDNDSYLVIELSSQSYDRIKTFKIDYLVFTNLNKEHLDTHKTMTRYFNAKKKIINLLKNKENLFINIDDNYGKKLKKMYTESRGYSLNDLKIINTNPIEFNFNNLVFKSKLSGEFNVYNIYSSYLLINKIINENEKIINALKDINHIEGRNNIYYYKTNKVIIDYAHTPFSFENIIKHYSNVEHNNLYILFGFGGNKDINKRSEMLEIAYKYSKNIILTEDNNRNESFINIIKSSLKKEKENIVIIQNRKEAIKFIMNKLTDNDILLILGKGNEDYMLKNNKIYPYSDYEEIKRWLV